MLSRLARCRRASIALEFALVAPVIIVLAIGVYDISRVNLLRQQLNDAAEAIAQNAVKLSLSEASSGVTSLTYTQMQAAMSAIYAVIPGLALGEGTGSYTGTFSVTLSSVVFVPLCALSKGCSPESTLSQTPYTLWSSILTEGGSQLSTSRGNFRNCGALKAVSVFPDDSTQLTKMISPASIILVPQVVADASYVYVPTFSLFVGKITLWASATLPAASGSTDQEITFNDTPPTGNVITCNLPSD